MINLEEIVTTPQNTQTQNNSLIPENSSYSNLDDMINNNNTFHGGFLIGLLGGLIILGCLLPLYKIRPLKSNSKSKLAPIQQTATLIK